MRNEEPAARGDVQSFQSIGGKEWPPSLHTSMCLIHGVGTSIRSYQECMGRRFAAKVVDTSFTTIHREYGDHSSSLGQGT